MKINWLWDTRLTEARVAKILKNENDPRFYIYAEKLFSRVSDPQIAFKYLSKELFYHKWPAIKERVARDAWAHRKVDFWQSVYAEIIL